MVWVLKGISQNNQAILETPRTKKIIHTHVHNLRHINKNALLQAKQRIKKEQRKITIISNTTKTITSEAKTWGELKKEIS